MTFIPYSRQSVTEADISAVEHVLRSSHLTQGPAIERFEKQFSELHGVKYAAAVSNATCALHLACIALGVGPGSLVWTVPISFVASANCALYCGASVDFVDIDPATRLMSVDALRLKLEYAEKAGALPKVVIPVDLTGLPCDYAAIRKLADRYGFAILADSSHAVGARYHGQPVGHHYVDAAVFSFHAVKIVTTGEGGMIATSRDDVARKVELLRSHGITRDTELMQRQHQPAFYYEQIALGFNYRMTDIQAALGTSQLDRLADMHRQRIDLADRYDELLAGSDWLLPIRLPDRISAWHLYVVEHANDDKAQRDQIYEAMRAEGIGGNLHYFPIHLQPFYRRLGFSAGDLPAAERYAMRALTIPLFPDMPGNLLERVVAILRS